MVQSLTNRLKNRFSLSVMELDHQESWQRSALGFAAVCRGASQGEQIRMAVLETVDAVDHSCSLLDFYYEIEEVLNEPDYRP